MLDPPKIDDPGASPGAAGSWPELGWPDNWRDRAAGGNDQIAKLIGRFTSPQTMAQALFNARQQLSEGRKATLPEGATPEQVATFRKENGVPEKAAAYLENLPAGLVIGELDKPRVAQFAEDMHALNQPPAVVHAVLQSYYKIQEAESARIADANESAKSEGMQSLMAEWGAEYKPNINAVTSMLKMMPEDAQAAIMSARDSNGIALFNQPAVLKAFAQIARELNPAGAVVPSGTGDAGKAVGDRIKEITSLPYDEYWANTPVGIARRDELTKLYAAEQKMKARAA